MSKIAHYRQLAGITQDELAADVGLGSGAAISNYEAGRRIPDVHTLIAIRDALRSRKVKVSLEELVDQPDSKPAA